MLLRPAGLVGPRGPTMAPANNDGAVIHIGDTFADVESQTTLGNQANDGTVLWVASNGDLGHGKGTAVVGYSARGIGVGGESGTGVGLHGTSLSQGGVFGKCDPGYGVWGMSATGTGVVGTSTSSFGVDGSSSSGTGVLGASGTGIGVNGHSTAGPGVVGESQTDSGVAGYSETGIGVHAEARAGTALEVIGKAHFSRSGRLTIPAGRNSVVVDLPGTSPSSMVFAVLASNRSGVFVRAAVPSDDTFTVFLNAAVGSDSALCWFVID